MVTTPHFEMKILDHRTLLTGEQFTDYCTPDGVINVPKELFNHVTDIYPDLFASKIYIYKIPYPNESDKNLAYSLNAPYPFQWIQKGDFIITLLDGYSFVENDLIFCAEHFTNAEILPNTWKKCLSINKQLVMER
jgi:hypothetical protein